MKNNINIKKNTVYEVIIDGWSNDGSGVCHIDGFAVFVPGTIIGEKWEIKILKVSNTAIYAKALNCLNSSPDRIIPKCPQFGMCGGCSTAHITYEAELKFKLESVNNALKHIGHLNYHVDSILGSSSPDHYRNKSITSVGLNKNSEPICGFYRKHSHDIISSDNCYLQKKLSNEINNFIINWIKEHKIKPYDELTGKGILRHIFIRESIYTDDVVVCLTCARGFGSLTEILINDLTSAFPPLTGIVLNINKDKGNGIIKGDFYTLFGRDYITDYLNGIKFNISVQSFYQVNPPQAEILYNKVLEFANLNGTQNVVDLYCGTGTIGLCIAKNAKKVIGIEIVEDAIKNAKLNAKTNYIENVEFICSDADKIDKSLLDDYKPDVIIVDPPRKGLGNNTIDLLINCRPQKIVYVSCNPATLARDLSTLTNSNYSISASVAVDMFPRTYHVETVVLLTKF